MLSILAGPRSSGTILAFIGVLVAVCTVVGCDKVPLLAPNLTTITLSADSTIVQSNGSANITATLLESAGTPVQNGTTVTFSTNLGRLSSSEARTVNGVATVQFMANGSSGVAEIRAASGGAKPADTANPALKLTVGAAAAGRITVSASPSTVPASGGSSTISATVSDTSGTALRNVAVTFSTTAGTLSTTVATTDANGNATTTLTTNREATVTASAGAGTGANTATVVVRANTAGTVTVTATPSPALVGQSVGISVTLTASASGTPFQRMVIDFGDGSSTQTGGSSTTVQHTYTRSGSFVVRATAFDQLGDSASSTTTVVVNSAPRPTVTISASANPTAGGVTTFTVGVTAAATGGGTIEDVTVNFGDGSSVSLGAVTGSGQQVQHVYSSAGTYTATVEAEDTNGASGTASTTIFVQPLLVSITPTPGAANSRTVSFTANPTAGVQIASYAWTFDDEVNNQATTTSPTVSHQYSPVAIGQRNVKVTVTSTTGQTATGSTVVTPP